MIERAAGDPDVTAEARRVPTGPCASGTADDELAFAHDVADAADKITLARFGTKDLIVDQKPDLTPVSDADRATERQIVDMIATARPTHAIVGEEYGATGAGPWAWIVDPIDGTKNYVRGIPVWATLIALTCNGVPVLGMVSAPALDRRWWSARKQGAFLNGDQIRVSSVSRVTDAQVSLGAERELAEAGWGEGARAITERAWRVRGFGDFWSHMLVAEGAADVALDAGVHAWDMAAVVPIVEEAGGRFSDFAGRPGYDHGSGLSTNGLVHDEVVALLRGTSRRDRREDVP
jgi:histidinol-phosphatase